MGVTRKKKTVKPMSTDIQEARKKRETLEDKITKGTKKERN